MVSAKNLLKKWPALYSIVRGLYLFIVYRDIAIRKYLQRNKIGRQWAARPIKEGDEWIRNFQNSINHPHRPLIVEKIAALPSVSSILEIGCNSGPNLYLLAKKFPNADIKGIDINPLAVEMGNSWFSREGITNVKLISGKAEELRGFADNSFDVVFTDAILVLISAKEIENVIKEMLRIARRALLMVERHTVTGELGDGYGLGVFIKGLWVRDYVALLKRFIAREQIRITKITPDQWPDEGWIRDGALIEVIKKKG